MILASTMKPSSLRPLLPRLVAGHRICISRTYAVQSPGNPTLQIFNRHTKYLQKERAAADVERSRQVDYLKDEVAVRLSERLLVGL
jgi:NADH dehydrogenase [ubiquinone] 1 alpha subcomplex assembly factor 5